MMKYLEIAGFLLLAALWGASFLFMRISAPVFGPVWLIEIRVLLAGLSLLPILIKLDLFKQMRRHWKPLFIVGCINSAIPFSLYAFASLYLPAGFTAILNATTPLFGVIIALFWLKEKLTIYRIIGLILGFSGVIWLVGWQSTEGNLMILTAIFAGILAALMYAIAAPFVKVKLSGVPALVITTGSLLGGAICLLPFLPFTLPQNPMTFKAIIAVISLALFSTSLAYIIFYRLIHKVGSTRALTVAYLVPIFAMIWGAVFLQEAITISMILSCGLILAGTAIANISSN
ncbi:MAG: DMT family transporter [Microcoleaceae cyanobacterium]